jgi:hypothetical protein
MDSQRLNAVVAVLWRELYDWGALPSVDRFEDLSPENQAAIRTTATSLLAAVDACEKKG